MSMLLTGLGASAPGGTSPPPPPPPPASLLDGLQAYWYLEDDQAAHGGPDWTPGPATTFTPVTLPGSIAAHALVCDEGDTALLGGNALPIVAGEDATIFLWVKPTELSSFWTAFGKLNNLGDFGQVEYAVYLRGDLDRLAFIVCDGTNYSIAVSEVPVVADTWYAVLAEWDAGLGKACISVNGETRVVGSNTGTPVPTARSQDLWCGYDGTVYPWQGQLSSVGMWDRLLTTEEKALVPTDLYPWS